MDLGTSKTLPKPYQNLEFLKGIKSGLPAGLGYIPIAMTFGLLAKNTGFSPTQGTLMSALVFAGASQFVAVNMLSLSIGWLEIVLTTFILNFRHFLMSTSLSQRLEIANPIWLWPIGFGLTDESFAIASMQDQKKISPYFMVGLNFTVYLAWVLGTIIGFVAAGALPEIVQSSMGIALYAMFIGILIPSIKKTQQIGFIAGLGALINVFLQSFITPGWSLVLSAITASFVAALIFKEV